MAPSTLHSSFASAAAGTSSDNAANRRDGSNGSEWPKTRLNGSQTFRRPSTQSRDNLQQASAASASAPYVPPHLNQQTSAGQNGYHPGLRHSKEQMLDVFRAQKAHRTLDQGLDRYFTAPFSRQTASRSDGKELGPEACWSAQPISEPLGLQEMDDEERKLFASVNSTMKSSNPKDGTGPTQGGRKTSMSGSYQASGSGSNRPGARRRETSDSFTGNGPLSPSESKTFFRNDSSTNTPPPALLRRRTDFKDEDDPDSRDEPGQNVADADSQSPFASLRRSGTGPPSAGLNPPSASPWSAGPQSSAFGAMGGFGSFSSSSATAADAGDKRPGFGSARSQSRFKDLLNRNNSEDLSPAIKEKASFGQLEKLPEEEHDVARSRLQESVKNRPNRSETNPYDDNLPRSSSAALSQEGIESMGFSAFGPTKDFAAHMDARTPHHRLNQPNEPMSPTNTNPYQSPQGGKLAEQQEEDPEGMPQPGPYAPFGSGRRDVFAGMEHRPQGSFGSIRGPSSMSGLGGLGNGWGAAGFASGTPGLDRPPVSAAFGSSVFSPMSDLQSPGAAGFGPGSFFGGSAGFGAGRPDKLSGLFPPAMQEQMRSDSRNELEGRPDPFPRDPFDGPPRRQESFRGAFDEPGSRPGEEAFRRPPPGTAQTPGGSGTGPRSSESPEQSAESDSQMPTAQQRQMVMPDRMRWVYRDPHGHVQGPWSGLEMHDWFKAGFFTAELQVKKLEDADYEPLAQLVRRIGNSREPFLVPQIGVPHGPAPSVAGNVLFGSTAAPAGQAQPPFANSFPSFGTTLTAHQQNALEQRKQEEQFLMARQKEFLQTHKFGMMNQSHPQGAAHSAHPLTHHPSAHSLQSQPSFGSITSPAGYQQSPTQGPIQPPPAAGPGFSGQPPQSMGATSGRDEEMSQQFGRMGLSERQSLSFGNPPSGQEPLRHSFGTFQDRDRDRILQEAQQADLQAHQNTFLGQQGRNERLEEFQELRGSMDQDDHSDGERPVPQPIGVTRPSEDRMQAIKQPPVPIGHPSKTSGASVDDEPLSLTQQVQRQAAANEAASRTTPIKAPPVSISPLPAPTPQHGGRPVAETLAAESRSAAQTPVETPGSSLAPWAERTAEMPKKSLKEIQADEAKRAAALEAQLAEQRRLQAEQERLAAAQAPAPPPAPGLPSTSTWATSASPGTPTTPGGSAWAKPVAAKPSSKTLAQIQKEEEARKQRVAAAQAVAQSQNPNYPANPNASGSRYAQMASKTVSGPSPQAGTTAGGVAAAAGGAWTTVGSGGKPKTPATVVAAPPTAPRTVSTSNPVAQPATRPPLTTTRSTSQAVSQKDKAKEELAKWTSGQISKSLSTGVNTEDFTRMLLELPLDSETIADAIYGATKTMDGRRFASEFIQRRKAAEKGQVIEDKQAPVSGTAEGSNKWNEVAKKTPSSAPKEDSSASFKVVSSKKKGKR